MGDIQFNGTPEEWEALVKKNKEQETLEEVEIISKQRIHKYRPMNPHPTSFFIGFRDGAKWQSEKMYSEEEVIQLLIKFNQEIQEVEDIRGWFEQFKNK